MTNIYYFGLIIIYSIIIVDTSQGFVFNLFPKNCSNLKKLKDSIEMSCKIKPVSEILDILEKVKNIKEMEERLEKLEKIAHRKEQAEIIETAELIE